MSRFSPEQIRDLAEAERLMDEGKIAYVMLYGERLGVSDAAMKEFGLRAGQTINVQVAIAVLEFQIADCSAQIALQKAQSSVAAGKRSEP